MLEVHGVKSSTLVGTMLEVHGVKSSTLQARFSLFGCEPVLNSSWHCKNRTHLAGLGDGSKPTAGALPQWHMEWSGLTSWVEDWIMHIKPRSTDEVSRHRWLE